MNAYQTYRQTQAQTAAPGELVVMLYRGAIRFVASGVEAIERRDIEAAHTNLIKAQTSSPNCSAPSTPIAVARSLATWSASTSTSTAV